MFLVRIKFNYLNQAKKLMFFLMIYMISLTPYTMALDLSNEGEVKVSVELKSSNVKNKYILPFQIFAEPADSETAEADRSLPRWLGIPKGFKAYKILAKDSSIRVK